MNEIDQYIDSLEGELKFVVIELRSLVMGASTELVESIKWKVPTYSINKMVCSIMAHKAHVNLQIFRGAEIQSADKLLGTGKGMRHLKLSELSDIDPALVREVLNQAVELDA